MPYRYSYARNPMNKLLFVLLSLFFVCQASLAAEESPEEGLNEIISLYKSKNFDILIKERYTEIYKAKNDKEVESLIMLFSKKMENVKRYKQTIALLESIDLTNIEISKNPSPQLTETKKMAVFRLKNGTYKLYLQKNGKWGFHL